MQRPQPNKLHDDLDALLDGRPVELTDELAPLVEVADILRIELAGYQLDPGVADRHLEQVLGDQGKVVQLPVRRPAGGWDVRRRIIAVALAAALVLAPATMASAAALPGQAMYPFKLAIEQVRIASVQWSPGLEAGERTRVADERLEEVESLFRLEMFNQLPGALKALRRAVVAAQVAVTEASREGELPSAVAAKLDAVKVDGGQVAEDVKVAALTGSIPLTDETREAVVDAVQESTGVLPPPVVTTPVPPPAGGSTTPTTGSPPGSTLSEATAPPPPPTTEPPPPPTTEPPPPPTTTPPPTTEPPPSNPPPPTTAPSPPDPPAADQARDAAGLGGAGKGAGKAGKEPPLGVEGTPPTSTP
jgi:hypothetical protein